MTIQLTSLYEVSSASSQPINPADRLNLDVILSAFGIGFVILLLVLLIFFVAYNVLSKLIHKSTATQLWKERVFLEVTVPREKIEESTKSEGKSDEKEIVSVGEQLYFVLSEFSTKRLHNILGKWNRISFEILSIDQKIRFLIVASQHIADTLERQIVALYPKADIKRHRNVTFFKQNTQSVVQEIELSGRYELPFRTYRSTERDPLNALTNALAGIEKEESAAIQIIVVPLKEHWQKKPRELALKIQQGQSPETVLGSGRNIIQLFSSVGKGVGTVAGDLGKTALDQFKNSSTKEQELKNEERDIDLTGKKSAIQLTPQQQDMIKKLEEKASKPGFAVTIRVVAAASTTVRARQIVDTVIPAFQIFDVRPFNGLRKSKKSSKHALLEFLIRSPERSQRMILNTEELTSLWHVPGYTVENSFIDWLQAKRPPLPLDLPGKADNTVFIGKARSGMQEKDVYMKLEDRFRHVYALGGSGSGKSVFLSNMVLQDIDAGNGVCVVDPHGETVDEILLRMPKHRKDDVILFSPSFIDRPLGLNMLEYDRNKPEQRTNVIDTLFQIWDKLYDLKQTGGPMFESYMKNAMRLVMGHEASGSTLMEIPKVLTDEQYRTFKLAMADDQQVVDFWEKEAMKAGGEASLENIVPYVTSKLNPFILNDYIRPMVGQQKSAINFRVAMDNKKIVLLKLEKGLIGEKSAYLIGMVIIGNLLMAGMGRSDGFKYNLDGTRTDILSKDRPPFFIYVDEMQNFLFDAIPQALEEIRKYKVGMVLAHQFVKQVIKGGDERIKDSIMANCASKFIFRAAAEDAEYLVKEFEPTLNASDLQNPERFTANTIMLIDGQKTKPFNLKPPPLSEEIDVAFRQELIEMTKNKYGVPAEEVEKDIKQRVEKFLF